MIFYFRLKIETAFFFRIKKPGKLFGANSIPLKANTWSTRSCDVSSRRRNSDDVLSASLTSTRRWVKRSDDNSSIERFSDLSYVQLSYSCVNLDDEKCFSEIKLLRSNLISSAFAKHEKFKGRLSRQSPAKLTNVCQEIVKLPGPDIPAIGALSSSWRVLY